jgi:hypothetical protein
MRGLEDVAQYIFWTGVIALTHGIPKSSKAVITSECSKSTPLRRVAIHLQYLHCVVMQTPQYEFWKMFHNKSSVHGVWRCLGINSGGLHHILVQSFVEGWIVVTSCIIGKCPRLKVNKECACVERTVKRKEDVLLFYIPRWLWNR